MSRMDTAEKHGLGIFLVAIVLFTSLIAALMVYFVYAITEMHQKREDCVAAGMRQLGSLCVPFDN